MESKKPNADGPGGLPISREEFNRLSGQVLGLTNAVRALIEAAPDRQAAIAAVERCFATESALGQSLEHVDVWTSAGIEHCLAELQMPIRHDWVMDADPGGLIAKAQQEYAERQRAMNASVMARLLRPVPPDDAASAEEPPPSA